MRKYDPPASSFFNFFIWLFLSFFNSLKSTALVQFARVMQTGSRKKLYKVWLCFSIRRNTLSFVKRITTIMGYDVRLD